MKALLIFPTKFEGAPFFKLAGVKKTSLESFAQLEVDGEIFGGLVSGYGCSASENRVRIVAKKFAPKYAILCGYCGACTKDLKEGDFVFETKSAQLKSAFGSINAKACKIACVKNVAGRAKKMELAQRGYGAVDMESTLFSKYFINAHFASFRAVSDSLESKIPAEFFDAMINRKTGGERFFSGKMGGVFVKNPLLIPRLAAFGVSAAKVSKIYSKKMEILLQKLAKI